MKTKIIGIILLILAPQQALAQSMINRDPRIICVQGYARSMRPPEAVTERIKREKAREQGVSVSCCELDHIIPLCRGGSPLDPANLQLQPWDEAKVKDIEEEEDCIKFCSGEFPNDEDLKQFVRTHP